MLGWFRSIWKPTPEAGYADQFGGLFERIEEEKWLPPQGPQELSHYLSESMYLNEILVEENCLQVLTDDDVQEMALYAFDDHFRDAHPGLTDYLVLPGWRLPDGDSDGAFEPVGRMTDLPEGSEPGTTYAGTFGFYDKCNLSDLGEAGGWRMRGVRPSDLVRYLIEFSKAVELDGALPEVQQGAVAALAGAAEGEDAGFRAAIRDEPGEPAHWNAYADWAQDRGLPPPGLTLLRDALLLADPYVSSLKDSRDPDKDLVCVTPHVAQACKHVARWGNSDLYHQWFFFDDRWAAAFPHVANGIFRFGGRWDVLSTTPEEES